MCVQRFDDSRSLAIRITYRISLRSSSLWKPRHPLLKVVQILVYEVRKIFRHHLVSGFHVNNGLGTNHKCDWIFDNYIIWQKYPLSNLPCWIKRATALHRRGDLRSGVVMIPPQVHLRRPCYDFTFLQMIRFKQVLASQSKDKLTIPRFHRTIQSVGATGGVYRGQGRNQCRLMICVYQEFLVHD